MYFRQIDRIVTGRFSGICAEGERLEYIEPRVRVLGIVTVFHWWCIHFGWSESVEDGEWEERRRRVPVHSCPSETTNVAAWA